LRPQLAIILLLLVLRKLSFIIEVDFNFVITIKFNIIKLA